MPHGAGVSSGAWVAIITRGHVHQMHTALERDAGIICADLVVFAEGVFRGIDATIYGVTDVLGTRESVVACVVCERVQTPLLGCTCIHGADVAVIAIKGRTAADAREARVPRGADFAIVAAEGVVRVGAPRDGIAGIVCTEDTVIAVDGGPDAFASAAECALGAEVCVIAGGVVCGEGAALERVADVVGAHVTVITGHRRSEAFSTQAAVFGGAGIAIVTCIAVFLHAEDTHALHRVTQSDGAWCDSQLQFALKVACTFPLGDRWHGLCVRVRLKPGPVLPRQCFRGARGQWAARGLCARHGEHDQGQVPCAGSRRLCARRTHVSTHQFFFMGVRGLPSRPLYI